MSKYAAKKKMLVAESEVYRELLKLEIQTFRIYGMRTKRRLTSIGTYVPLVMSGFPMLTGLFRRKGGGVSSGKLGSWLMLGWKAYQKFAPLFGRGPTEEESAEPDETAAEEYLSNRL